MSPLHQWARYYAGRGFAIFPLVPGTKSPFADSHGSTEATTDLRQVDAWWSANPDANIGCKPSASCGGLYVYDVDPRNGGVGDPNICSPMRVLSPGGGYHDWLVAPNDPTVRYSGAPAQGVDGKYNGYVALPPSLHPNGKRYEWVNGPDAAPAPIPEYLIRRCKPRERTAPTAGTLTDTTRITEALARLDPTDYNHWVQAMASVKHWEDTTEGADGIGFELVREWSEQDPRHDDGQFADKWETWNSDASNARTLGSLLHDAGLTAEQNQVDPLAAFTAAGVPAELPAPAAVVWTTEPVSNFKADAPAADVLGDMLADDHRGFAARWQAGGDVLDDLAWRCGSNCERVAEILALGGRTVDRDAVARACAGRTTWYTVKPKTPEQAIVMADQPAVPVDDGTLVHAFRVCLGMFQHLPGLFERDGLLVRVTADGRILDHDVHSLSHLLETFLQLTKGGKGAAAKCPETLARRLLGHGEYPGVRSIKAAVPMPTARPDGSVITEQGLDVSTGLYLLGAPIRDPRALAGAELEAAKARVWAPFREFPFANDAARGTLVAALLTAVVRPALDTAPAFLVNAQVHGTGKTLLSEALMIAATGSTAPLTLPDDPAEQGKTLISMLLEGPRGVLFDNVMSVLKPNATFCSAMTSESYRARGLGGMKLVSVSNRALWVLNGNNVELRGDVVRRVLSIVLDSPENPETQRHDFDPREVIRGGLAEYRADLLDLIVSYQAAGMPLQSREGMASFEQWNRLVRNCVLWLGFADPLQTLKEAQAEDGETMLLRRMLTVWYERFGDEAMLLRDLAAHPFEGEVAAEWQEVYGLITTFKGRQDPAQFGYWLRRMKGRKVDGMHFTAGGVGKGGVTKWCVKKS